MKRLCEGIRRTLRRGRDIMTMDVSYAGVCRLTRQVAGRHLSLTLMDGKGGYNIFMAKGADLDPLYIVKVSNRFRDGLARRAIVNHHKEFSYLSPPERFRKEKTALDLLSPHDLAPRHVFSRGHLSVEECIKGERFFDLIKRGDDKVPMYTVTVLKAVTRMHELGVFHGDLHCRNVLIDDGRARFIDFEHALNPELFTPLEMRAYDYLILLVTALAADREGLIRDAAGLVKEGAAEEIAKAGLAESDFSKPIAVFGYDRAVLGYFFMV